MYEEWMENRINKRRINYECDEWVTENNECNEWMEEKWKIWFV